MLYAVTIPGLNVICFVSDRPDECEWEVQDGVELELTPIYGTWTPDLGPLRQILCVSHSNPKFFKIFSNPKDIGPSGYQPTGRDFGGLFPKATWERFAKIAPNALRILAIGDDEPVDATKEVVGALE
jgi:hypothetical protein